MSSTILHVMVMGQQTEIECTDDLCGDCSHITEAAEYDGTRDACSLFGGCMRKAPDQDYYRLKDCKRAEVKAAKETRKP
jgi:hypothetical protein